MNQLLPLTESEALFAPFQDAFLSRQMDFSLAPAAAFRSAAKLAGTERLSNGMVPNHPRAY
jgi:hypothetical protein